jgi:hypothetical protein
VGASKFIIAPQVSVCYRLGFPRKSFFLLSTKLKFRRNFILISSKFRCPDFLKFRFRFRNRNFVFDFDGLLSTKSKFRQNSILISPKFRCRDFGFDIGIPMLISISQSEFRFRRRKSDFCKRLQYKISKFQTIFHRNESKILFLMLIGIWISTV